MPAPPATLLRKVRLALGVLALVFLGHVVLGENPWSSGVWEHFEWGKPIRPRDAMTFTPIAAAVNLLVLGLLFVTARLWLAPLPDGPDPVASPPPARDRGLRWGLIAIAAVLLVLQAWPRMDHSLWTDEEYSARRSVVGEWEIEGEPPNQRPEWERVGWRDTLWAYRQPNNHVPFSIAARLTTKVAGTQRPEEGMEVAFRIPALVAGIAGLATIALFATRLGAPWAGVFAAWLLVGHPWYLRFASAGRGYSIMLALLPLFWWAAWRVLERPTGRRFVVFGGLQFLLMWSYPALVWLVAVTNLWMLLEWFLRSDARERAWAASARLIAAASFGGMAFLQLMIPNLVQLPGYLERKSVNLSPRWLWNLYSYLLAGAPFGHNEGDPVYPTISDLIAVSPSLVWMTVWVFLLAVAAGFVRLARRGGADARFAVVMAIVGPLTFGWAWATDSMLYQQYLVFTLTALVLFAALGFGLPSAWRPTGGMRALGAALAIAVACLLIFIGQPSRRALLDRPVDAFRESVLATRTTLDPHDPSHQQVITTSISGCNEFYDPWCRQIRSLEELQALVVEADADGKLLFVNYARPELIGRRSPEQLAFVNRDDLFETAGTFAGYQLHRTRFVRRYRAGSFDPDAAAEADPADARPVAGETAVD